MTTAVDNWPAAAGFVAIAASGQLPTAPSYTTLRDATREGYGRYLESDFGCERKNRPPRVPGAGGCCNEPGGLA